MKGCWHLREAGFPIGGRVWWARTSEARLGGFRRGTTASSAAKQYSYMKLPNVTRELFTAYEQGVSAAVSLHRSLRQSAFLRSPTAPDHTSHCPGGVLQSMTKLRPQSAEQQSPALARRDLGHRRRSVPVTLYEGGHSCCSTACGTRIASVQTQPLDRKFRVL